MQITATTINALATEADTVVVGVFDGGHVAHDLSDGTLQRLFDRGEAKTTFKHLALAHDDNRRVLVIGLGDRERFDAERARIAAGVAYARAVELGTETLCWEVPHRVENAIVAALVEGTALRAYRYLRFKPAPPDHPSISQLLISSHHEMSDVVETAALIVAAQNRVRDLANAPANEMTPAALAERALEIAITHDAITVTVLDEDEIRESGMGAFAAVAQGSDQPAKLIHITYDGPGSDEGAPLLALVGKAVTFDTGGLWLKQPLKMHEMKFDMAGGAAVIEAFGALAELRAPVRVLGIVGASENMISGQSMRPGDIVTALDGTTIQIDNTDAEGRLILADCITYALRHGAARIVDIATLTGGVITALGSTHAGLFSNDEAFAVEVQAAATAAGELLWRLPLHEHYAKMTEGRYAKLTNLPEPRVALASTAAEFIHHFVPDGVPWAHLDIAGTADDVRGPYIADRGATGFGLRLLVELARSHSGGSATAEGA
jgi:leucyl aminopeptidase